MATVKPEEYIETFKSEYVNKKHKGLRKGGPGMEFENYLKRINSVADIETFGQLSAEKQKQNRFPIKNNVTLICIVQFNPNNKQKVESFLQE